VFGLNGFYHRSVRRRSAFLEGIDIVQSCLLGTLALIAFTYFYEEYRYSRITLVMFAALNPFFIIATRSTIRKLLRIYRKNRATRQILVIGSGEVGLRALGFRNDSEVDVSAIYGLISVGDAKESDPTRLEAQRQQIAIFQIPSSWPDFFTNHPIQCVIFALPASAYSYLESYVPIISEQVADVRVVPDILKYAKLGAGIELIEGTPVVRIHASPLEGYGGILKRVFDLVASGIGIVLLSPLLLAIALLVKLSSRGPIFYRQERMGLDGQVFHCLKFRSMPIDAEKGSGPVWAKSGEDRATPIGKFIRKFSIDELPQLFNVLKGEMSLVGPRPERPVFVHQFRKLVPGYMLRHKAKAGITGWAQVNGWRGNTSIEKRIECDLYYIQNWSLWLDIKILLMTVNEVLFSRNAY
jgi:Undecaprenyl-phosphate glucose phosphotransferase